MTIINSRADLDAIQGTPRHAAFVAGLIGTLAHDPAAKFIDTPAPTVAEGQQARWDGSTWIVEAIPPAPTPGPDPVPQTIKFRQLVLAALGAEWITPAEAEAWAARNALPPILSGVIATLPAADQTAARVTALTMAEADRHDPLMIAVATAAGADSEQIDQFFRQAAQL